MLTFTQVLSYIQNEDLSNEDLNRIIEAVKWSRTKLSREIKGSLAVGDRVSFHSTKRGQTMQGTVEKVAIKYVTVATREGRWRVPANMLTVEE